MTPAMLAASHATIPDIVTFIVCAAMVLGGAIGVVTSRNPVHAALSLVLTLFGVAVLFVEQDADFLAAVQIIVYAGAIVVLFLFVIMFLGVDRQENIEAEPLKGQRPLAILLILVSLGGVFALAVNANWVTGAHAVAGSTTEGGHSNVWLLGKSVFTTYLFAFEAPAALLVIAVVGAVFLARRPSSPTDEEPGEPIAEYGGAPVLEDPAEAEPTAGATAGPPIGQPGAADLGPEPADEPVEVPQ
ncbi:MAG TPA: NADH-quinone oxidoreductase subunit J [Acidimicrobiales bacterium]|jgi:NADH-quinone oxidoreductase subunit J|nr:NADH-quinone oxidoreductase subunit J [Acidimicrobiales bacterium]